ncbi:PREDICTED: RING-H2 finger protein ATL39-like [Nelumbo nucifera]|uniref:RING-type domain-containing protein n=2 Tax=Nelumbo nucifera TaxID=4432 RepID=A0A822XFV3_NELNU|nr:PREDICTED: RING-H2 finger protein ATL39-like [Nelumbo nucifera]DAD18782.1 TPA_asm: hypothetical protein HUJ06_020245 [Nelumbo nucifera]
MLASGMNLITTVIGFGMSATFIVFVCTRLICGRIRTVESRPVFEMDSRADVEQPEHRTSGLEPVVVAAIPTMKFSREAFSSIEDAQCSICLSEYEEKEILRIMPNCSHNFHLACIDQWLQKQSTCPICRFPLKESFERKCVGSPTLTMLRWSMDSPQVVNDQSHQWLLPDSEHPLENGGNQDNHESTTRNLESAPITESETRR